MTVKTAFDEYTGRLKAIYPQAEAAAIAGWIFEAVVQTGASLIALNPHKEIPPDKMDMLQAHLAKLLTHKPVQYVLGEAWFYKMKFVVNEQVLIPRPETEELVEWCIKQTEAYLRAGNPIHKSIHILDVGTGSGCMAITLKKYLPAAQVTAIDVSEGALQIARQNMDRLKAEIGFVCTDFLNETGWGALPVFDVIVSNPPYIPMSEKVILESNVVAHEPHTALFVPDNNPLLFYEKIARFGMAHLMPGGFIMMETHENYASQTAALFEGAYHTVISRKDMSGKERMVMAAR
jgi:release factor glutamine methyltransferase